MSEKVRGSGGGRLSRRTMIGTTGAGIGALTLSPSSLAAANGTSGFPLVTDRRAAAVVVPRSRAVPGSEIIWEAEAGSLTAPMRRVDDPSSGATGGSYIDSPPGGQLDNGLVRYQIEVETAGSYEVWARTWCPDGDTDSFYVTVDDHAEVDWRSTKISDTWTWFQVGEAGGANFVPAVYELAAGSHELTVRVREAGGRIDQLRLSPVDSVQPQLDHATDDLVTLIATATGAELPVRTPDQLDDPDVPTRRIFVGWPGPDPDPELVDLVAGLDVDGFVIDATKDALTILGPTDWGTRYGVYEMLERFVGVRWLMPGPDGVDVPTARNLVVPPQRIVQEPDFKGRAIAPLFLSFDSVGLGPTVPEWTSTDPQVQWAVHNRTRSRTTQGGNHNLFRIFPPAEYADPNKPDTYHPEYYPIINGEVKLPALNSDRGWQPRFDTDETVEVAVRYALDYFERYPDRDFLSLSTNDNNGFSDTDIADGPLNSLGYPNASDSYYHWVNTVIDRILTERPDYQYKFFPVLAYYEVADPPSFDLRPQAVPMITRDSHSWSDPISRASVIEQFQAWEPKVTELIWYDYPSGARFIVPRMYVPDLANSYRWAREHKVAYQYGDMVPDLIGEGPKTWLYLKLLWDVDIDVDELADEWYRRVAGSGAGPLKEYFDHWQEFWATRAKDTPFWEFGRDRTYVFFGLCCYLDEVSSSEIAHCRRLLDRARSLADTAVQRRRIDLIRQRFSYTELSVASYPHPVPEPRNGAAALSLTQGLRRDAEARVGLAQDRLTRLAELEADPVLRGRYHFRGHYWTGVNGDTFFHLVDHLQLERQGWQRVRQTLESVAEGEDAPVAARFARLVLRVAGGEAANLAPNGSFEDGGLDAPPWELRGNIERTDGIGRDGGAGMRIWALPGVPLQSVEDDVIGPVPITPGLTATRIWYRTEGLDPTGGIMSLKYHLRTAAGAEIRQCLQPMRRLSDTGSDWAWISVMEDVPATLDDKEVGQVRLVVSLLGHEGSSEVHWDDLQTYNEHG